MRQAVGHDVVFREVDSDRRRVEAFQLFEQRLSDAFLVADYLVHPCLADSRLVEAAHQCDRVPAAGQYEGRLPCTVRADDQVEHRIGIYFALPDESQPEIYFFLVEDTGGLSDLFLYHSLIPF